MPLEINEHVATALTVLRLADNPQAALVSSDEEERNCLAQHRAIRPTPKFGDCSAGARPLSAIRTSLAI